MKKKKESMTYIVVVVSLCMAAIMAIAYVSHRMHTPRDVQNVDSTRRDFQEPNLRTLEDSIHYFEDGM